MRYRNSWTGSGNGVTARAHAGGQPRLRHQGLCTEHLGTTGTPPVAQKKQHSTIGGRTTRHVGYAVNLRLRKRVEEVFSWMKTMGSCRHTRYRGVDRTGLAGYLVATASGRMAKFLAEPEAMTGPPGMPRGLLGPRNPRGTPHRQFQGPAGPPKLRCRTPLGVLMASKTFSSAACYRPVPCSRHTTILTRPSLQVIRVHGIGPK